MCPGLLLALPSKIYTGSCLRDPKVPGMKPGSAACKASALPDVLFLQPET